MGIQPKPIQYNTLIPYKEISASPIIYSVCKDFDHISRHKSLRQIAHNPLEMDERFIALETPNPITTYSTFVYYDVPKVEEDRLDIIAQKFFGSAQYSWVIAYFNDIDDGFTVHEGQRLRILKQFTALFSKNEILAPIPAMTLNLGTE